MKKGNLNSLFEKKEITKYDKRIIIKKKNLLLKDSCSKCGLNKKCNSPKIKIQGKGKKKILIIGEFPSEIEDRKGIFLIGKNGSFLKEMFLKNGINIDEDCWIIAAILCHPFKSISTIAQINYCRYNLLKAVKELKPEKIFTFGKVAIQGLLGNRLDVKSIDDWVKQIIPDNELNCFIIPNYSPYQILNNEKDLVLFSIFSNILKRGISFDRELKKYEFGEINILNNLKEVIKFLKGIKAGDIISFDYETNTIKSHAEYCKIICISICKNNEKTFVFEIFKDTVFKTELKRILQDKNIKKISQNLQFEHSWTKEVLGYNVEGWYWDTMVIAHILNNRASVGLKYLGYINFGMAGYENEILPYFKNNSKSSYTLNRIDECDKNKLFYYCGVDSELTYRLYEKQKKQIKDNKTKEAIKLFIDGITEFAYIQQNGIRFDYKKYEEQFKSLTIEIDTLYKKIQNAKEIKSLKLKEDFNSESSLQMRGLLKSLHIVIDKKTVTLQDSTDKSTLSKINNPLIKDILEKRHLLKIRDTFLAQFSREAVKREKENNDYFIYPNFGLHIAETFRSCVAKGSFVLANRDYIKYPQGIPIEKIKKGDYVYCFDDNLKLQLKKVLWAGKTGRKKVIRIYYKGGAGKSLFLDLTPEHLVRNVYGDYIPAKDLLQDFRKKTDSKKSPKSRVLSCHRCNDRLFVTHSKEFKEHIFIYEKRNNIKLKKGEVIHHKDRVHLNHNFFNLEKMTKQTHGILHYKDGLGTKESREKNICVVKQNHKDGKYTYKRGKESPLFLNLSSYDCLKILFYAKGKSSFCIGDFDTFKKHCEINKIDIKKIQLRFNRKGNYIYKGLLLKNLKQYGFSRCQSIFNLGYYGLKQLCEEYLISYERSFKNQFGFEKKQEIILNNHVITSIEYINKETDVYDIEVEECHNFIVNEICVHNSSSNPNFQNIPIREERAKQLIRGLLYARKGNQILECDLKSIEVSVGVCYHNDPVMKKYVEDETTDMHRDMAMEIFLLKKEEVTKKLRYFAKNGFVFPEFYGSTSRMFKEEHDKRGAGDVTWNIWEMLETEDKLLLAKKGIRNLFDFQEHLEEIENNFWYKKFVRYSEWKKEIVAKYNREGFVEIKTGFKCYGPLERNAVMNYPIQGAAFHCNLWGLIQMNQWLRKNKMKTRMIGQIHDSQVFDLYPSEKKEVLKQFTQIMCNDLKEYFEWINVPIKYEAEITNVDCSWETKKEIKI